MGIRKQTWFIAICDICKYEFENGDGGTQGFNTKAEAKSTVIEDCDWIIKNGKLTCPWCVENINSRERYYNRDDL